MKSTLEGETKQDEPPSGLIDRVPESLLREGTSEVLYHPQVLFLGLYHFKGKDQRPAIQTESLKSEVARYVHLKIKGVVDQKDSAQRVNQPEVKQEKKKVDEIEEEEKGKGKESYGKDDESGLYSVIERFEKKEKQIRDSYVGEFNFMTNDECAWMMARDACFVLQVLESFSEDAEEKETTSIERPLSRIRYHPLMTDIVKDMLKMENQLPFWALKEIRPDIEDWFESALKKLSPVKVKYVRGRGLVNTKKVHILQLLHDYIVDSEQSPDSLFSSFFSHSIAYFILMSVCEPACDRFSELCSGPACDHFAKPCLQHLWNWMKMFFGLLSLSFQVIIVILLSPVLFVMFIIFVSRDFASLTEWETREHVPTVEELKRVGVKFQKLKGMKKGISDIHFKDRNSTLYLPQVKVDNSFEVILRNLIALEICSREREKPITRYAILMNDLINTKEDVAILRGEDIIINKLGNDEDTAKLWNSMVPSTEMPRYYPIDKAISSIHDYRDKWWKILWAQFIMIHCSKPWLVVSLFAGFTLLLLTIVQVVCLFESCQIK